MSYLNEFVAQKIIHYWENSCDKEYHKKRIAIIEQGERELAHQDRERKLTEIRSTYPEVYVIIGFQSGYVDFDSEYRCFSCEELARKTMNMYYFNESDPRCKIVYEVHKKLSTKVSEALLLNMDNTAKP